MLSLVITLLLYTSSNALPEGFIYTGDLNLNTPILVSLRYGTRNNFVGDIIRGYENIPARGAVVTTEAGLALGEAQNQFLKDGYKIVIYDSYRPTRAVDHFVEWSQNEEVNEEVKRIFYPNVEKSQLFELDYIALRSGHSRGSTVDLTLMRVGAVLTDVQIFERTLNNNYTISYMEDGTLDMGSSFDIFDEVSHYENIHINDDHKQNREYLKSVMESVGFVVYSKEWWHFRLSNETFPDQYFDFEMHEPSNQGIIMVPWTWSLLITSIVVLFVSSQ